MQANAIIMSNFDSLQNLVSRAGSEVDPTVNNVITPDCPIDRITWYQNGGIAKKVCTFWSDVIGTSLEVVVAGLRESDRNKAATTKLQDWLNAEYMRLGVLEIFKEAEAQCAISGDRKSTRLNSSHVSQSRMPSSA